MTGYGSKPVRFDALKIDKWGKTSSKPTESSVNSVLTMQLWIVNTMLTIDEVGYDARPVYYF